MPFTKGQIEYIQTHIENTNLGLIEWLKCNIIPGYNDMSLDDTDIQAAYIAEGLDE